ncbi:MAG: 2-amino-4-hydroxy-6-hydroxymethyldihydropteridine diphosphokinase [Bacteroidetes bacterium]|nr:2-amino-4-hydroxy-6-hydroxymethyldihydropteridine diphosphokinase [Bacteroidota bacterium]MBS1756657.1 2-amino-4-hydroxy-6-hydroxymethyldihydropteridine diphosphokinase [Bacteroidota bacterium]
MNTIYLLLGSNIGDSKKMLLQAAKKIEKHIGTIARKSSMYKTAAWGNTLQPDFLNQVLIVYSALEAKQTIQKILQIEKDMGRIRTIKNAPRIIDIDILFFNKEIIHTEELTVPHIEIKNRRFVLVPLNELSPHLKHPVLKSSIHQLLLYCPDKLEVKKNN